MAFNASVIINRVQETLLDQTGVYWQVPELIDYLNGAINAVASAKPDTFITTVEVELAANTATQAIPSNGYQLVDITRNLDGTQRAITNISLNHLNHSDPNWMNTFTTQSQPDVMHYMNDLRNPKIFYVYPVPSTPIDVEMVYLVAPPVIANLTDSINIDYIYENPLYFYTLGEAYSKNSKRGDLTKASTFYNLALSMLQGRAKAQLPYTPQVPNAANQNS